MNEFVSSERFKDCQANEKERNAAVRKDIDDLKCKVEAICDSINRWKGSMLAITTIASILGSGMAVALVQWLMK